MLFYLSLYVLAAILLFQGTQLLGELSGPLGTVPPEVKPNNPAAGRWGGFLVTYGAAMVVIGLLSHGCAWLEGALPLLRGAGVALEAVFGLWLVFGRKVDYTPAPVQGAPAHH